MRIGIDARLIRIERGMGNALRTLLVAIDSNPPADLEFFLYVDEEPKLRLQSSVWTWRFIGAASYPLWEQIVFPRALRRDNVEVLYAPANTGPIIVPHNIKRYVLTLHDVIFLDPTVQRANSFKQRMQNNYYRLCVPRVVRRASTIVTDSMYSRGKIASSLGISAGCIKVVPLAVTPAFDGARWTNPKADAHSYFIAPGAEDPRKNTAGMLRAYAVARRDYSVTSKLIVYGLTDAMRAKMSKLCAELALDDHVDLRTFVENDTLLALFSGALAMIFASKYEGFGLPPLEAMASGLPVISSNATSIPEVTEDAALMFDPDNGNALAMAMNRIESDDDLRASLSERGLAQARRFSPTIYASRMLSLFRGE